MPVRKNNILIANFDNKNIELSISFWYPKFVREKTWSLSNFKDLKL